MQQGKEKIVKTKKRYDYDEFADRVHYDKKYKPKKDFSAERRNKRNEE